MFSLSYQAACTTPSFVNTTILLFRPRYHLRVSSITHKHTLLLSLSSCLITPLQLPAEENKWENKWYWNSDCGFNDQLFPMEMVYLISYNGLPMSTSLSTVASGIWGSGIWAYHSHSPLLVVLVRKVAKRAKVGGLQNIQICGVPPFKLFYCKNI